MGELLLKSTKIYIEEGMVGGALLIQNNKIKDILVDEDLITLFTGKIMDLEDNIIIPGLIDLHIHGGGGWQLETTDPKSITGFTEYLPSLGITSYLPTVGGGTKDEIIETLNSLSKTINNGIKGAKIPGIHLEGPFINKKKKGAFVEERLLDPSIDIMEQFLEASQYQIIYITLAPEIEGAYDLISYLRDKNIVVAGGHTNANYEETIDAISHGVQVSTHTGNAQSGIHHRKPGAFLGYLMDDRVYCELISDFFHIHKAVVDMIIRLKSLDKICLISDTTFVADLGPGKYDFLGNTITIDNEGWSKLDSGTIAGSTKSLLDGVRNIVKELNYPLEEVVKMSSLNQAKLLGIDEHKGSIAVGKDADLLVLNKNLELLYTFVEGEIAFDHKKDNKDELKNPEAKKYLISLVN